MRAIQSSVFPGVVVAAVLLAWGTAAADDDLIGQSGTKTLCHRATPRFGRDLRAVRTGLKIPDEGYCDQPYIVVTKDGGWLCVMTTGAGHEGQKGQHVVSTFSRDQGHTWSKPVDIERADGPEASWVVPLITPNGRVYGFYTYNGDNVHTLSGKPIRTDMLGWYVCKYTDDNGKTWSKKRYRLPMRKTACDRSNDWKGDVQIFWGIDKPTVLDGSVMFAFTKLGRYMLDLGEGWFYRSDNLLTETDVEKIRWELLPLGDHGLRAAEFGSIQEEHNFVPLGDGTLYCVYRTTKGYPCHARSTDGGRSWTKPAPMTYTPGGRKIKTPRACPKLWRTKNGKFLFWYHNNGGQSFQGRNPVWLAGGVEKDGRIHWSQPEIVLYDRDPNARMSYPDLVEQDGRYWVTETQKTVARVHELDKRMLEGLWTQGRLNEIARDGLILELGPEKMGAGEIRLPEQLDLEKTGGAALDFWVRLKELKPGQVLFDSRTPQGKGIAVTTTEAGTLRIDLSDGETGENAVSWDCDPGVLRAGKVHHVVIIVDARPGIISFVVDGALCDGGEHRTYGWTRYEGTLGDVSGLGKFRIGPSLKGDLLRLRVYNRYLRTSEAVSNYHAGP